MKLVTMVGRYFMHKHRLRPGKPAYRTARNLRKQGVPFVIAYIVILWRFL